MWNTSHWPASIPLSVYTYHKEYPSDQASRHSKVKISVLVTRLANTLIEVSTQWEISCLFEDTKRKTI